MYSPYDGLIARVPQGAAPAQLPPYAPTPYGTEQAVYGQGARPPWGPLWGWQHAPLGGLAGGGLVMPVLGALAVNYISSILGLWAVTAALKIPASGKQLAIGAMLFSGVNLVLSAGLGFAQRSYSSVTGIMDKR